MHRTREDARKDVLSALQRLDANPGKSREELGGFADSFIEERDAASSGFGTASPPPWAATYTFEPPFSKGNRYYAIRNEDLNLLGSLMPAGGSVGAAYWLGTGLASPLIGAGIAVVLLGRSAMKKGVRLTRDQYLVLMSMKVAGPCTEERLAYVCARMEGRTDGDWAMDRVEKLLGQMQGMATSGGSVISLVSKDREGLWHPNA